MFKNFILCPDELITKTNETLIVKLPKSEKQKQQETAMQHIMESWSISDLKMGIYLNPQKSRWRNYEADRIDGILQYKEQMTTFLASFVEGFNRLDLPERQVIYYYYFKELSKVKIAEVMNISERSIQRLKNKAVINLIENIEIASFLKGCFLLEKLKKEN